MKVKFEDRPDLPEAVKKQLKDGTFCPIPFLQLEFTPLGNISACCFSGEYKVGSVEHNTIEEIWNSDVMQQWRREFITGDIKICKNAIKSFNCQVNYQHLNDLVDLSEIQKEMPKRLDLRLNGRCNLECVMCDVWSQPNGMYDKSNFWEIGPTKIFPYLKEVDMLGGEPFIQKDTFRLLDEVLKVNPDCTWGFITNCHYKVNKQLTDALDKLKLRHIHMSLDAITPETFAKVRVKGDLNRVMDTVHYFIEMRKKRSQEGRGGYALFASFCVQKDNWFELPEFMAFCNKYDLIPIVQELIGREHLGLNQLTADQKSELKFRYTTEIPSKFQGHVSSIVQNLR